MRALGLLTPLLLLSSCWHFQDEFNKRCAKTLAGEDGGFTDATQCEGVSLGGGGGTDGGGAGGGAGGGSGGGGTGGGGATCSRADSGCFGAGEWCWESPKEIPGNELYVAFTTPDAGGVWAAGAGPTLVYFENGNITNKTHLLLIDDSADPYAEPAAVTSVAVVDDGVFLAGQRMDLLQKSPADALFRSNGGRQWDALGTDSRGRLYGVSSATRGTLQRFDTGGVVPLEFNFANTEPVSSLAFDLADTAYVTTGEHALRFDLSALEDGGGTVDVGVPLLKQTNEFLGPVARIPDGGVLVGGKVLHEFDGMDWVTASPSLPFGGAAVTSMVVSGSSFWIFGDQGNVFNATTPLTGMSLPTNALGATAAPGGEAWVVGAHGMIARVKSGGSNSLAAPLRGNDIRALYVTDTVAYAAQNEAVLVRTGNTWIEDPRLSGSVNGHQWIAVAAVPAADGGLVVWAIDQDGKLFKDDGTRSSGELMLTLAAPFIDYYPRSATTLPLPDGGALLGYGKVILRLTANAALNYDGGTIVEGVLADGGTPPDLFTAPVDMISGLAQTNQALVVTGHMDLAKTSRLYSFKGGSWSAALVETPVNGLIEDVAACQNGSFLAVGNHALLKRLDASGTGVSEVMTGQMPSGVDFASVWCGPNDEAWVLSRSGDVLRYGTSGMPTRERTGWGRRDNNIDPIDASAIRGNGRFIFISGGSSALISRPVCN